LFNRQAVFVLFNPILAAEGEEGITSIFLQKRSSFKRYIIPNILFIFSRFCSTATMTKRLTRVSRVLEEESLNSRQGKSYTALQTVRHASTSTQIELFWRYVAGMGTANSLTLWRNMPSI